MNYLIDTHILLWYIVGDKRIDKEVQYKIEDVNNLIFVSNASLWEIAIKVSIGKLKLKGSLKDLRDFLEKKALKYLSLTLMTWKLCKTYPSITRIPLIG